MFPQKGASHASFLIQHTPSCHSCLELLDHFSSILSGGKNQCFESTSYIFNYYECNASKGIQYPISLYFPQGTQNRTP